MSVKNSIHQLIDSVCNIIDILINTDEQKESQINIQEEKKDNLVYTNTLEFNKTTILDKDKIKKVSREIIQKHPEYNVSQIVHLVAEEVAIPLTINTYIGYIDWSMFDKKRKGGKTGITPLNSLINFAALVSLGFSTHHAYIATCVPSSKQIKISNTKFPERIFRDAIAMSPRYLQAVANRLGIDIEKNIQENLCDEKDFVLKFSNMYRMKFDQLITKEQFMEVYNSLCDKTNNKVFHYEFARELGLKLKLPISHGTVRTLGRKFNVKFYSGKNIATDPEEVVALLKLGIPENYICVILGKNDTSILNMIRKYKNHNVSQAVISKVKEKYKDYITIYSDNSVISSDKKLYKGFVYPVEAKNKYISALKSLSKQDINFIKALSEAFKIVKYPISTSTADAWIREAGISFKRKYSAK